MTVMATELFNKHVMKDSIMRTVFVMTLDVNIFILCVCVCVCVCVFVYQTMCLTHDE